MIALPQPFSRAERNTPGTFNDLDQAPYSCAEYVGPTTHQEGEDWV